ncbi:hypothetical protein [Campylobacter hominis]|uniref:hypothetical protein n=1 Tax=Campylobacter hominis TaxID=76517 RepID=UPI00248AC177|nr:hypothetical protein [Campylobacter hominis]
MSDSDRLPEIVSYWKLEDDFILYSDLDNSDKDSDKEEYFFIIYGKYNHKNSEEKPSPALGMCWKNYPLSHGVLCPIVLDEETSKIILSGLSSFYIMKKDTKKLEKINKIYSELLKN